MNKILRNGQQACVEYRARCALQAGQAGEQLARAYNGQAGHFPDDVRGFLLEHAAVAHAVDLADRAALHVREPVARVCAQHVPVRLFDDLTSDGGLAGEVADVVRVGKAVVRAEAVDAAAVNAHEQQPRAAEFAFYAGVGGERGGQAGDRGFAAQRGVQPVERFEDAAR